MTRQEYLESIVQAFLREFNESSLNSHSWERESWRSEEESFKRIVDSLGLHFVKVVPDSLNCDMFLIAKYDYDEEGFMVQKNICIYRRVTGVYGGCLVQLKDVNGNEIVRLGRIREKDNQPLCGWVMPQRLL